MNVLVLSLSLFTLLFAAPLHAAQQPPPPSGTNLGGITGGRLNTAHIVIEKKCTACHTDRRIWKALSGGQDMHAILKRMEQKGAKLSDEEQSTLRIFWKETPLKK